VQATPSSFQPDDLKCVPPRLRPASYGALVYLMLTVRVILVQGRSKGLRLVGAPQSFCLLGAEADPDNVLEAVRIHFLNAWRSEVHALRWLFPNDILLAADVSDPFLVLHVDTIGNLPVGNTAVVNSQETSQAPAIDASSLLMESTRPCPFQPWSEPDWLRKCSDWLVRNLGPDAVREIRQIRVNATGAVLKVTGRRFTYFLKALPSFLSYETRLLTLLDGKLPEVCATLLYVRPDDNTHITQEIEGCSLATIDEPGKWEAVLASVARMQIASAKYANDMRLAGVPSRNIRGLANILGENLKGLLNMQEGAPNRLRAAELRRIPAMASMAADDCRRLEECGLPEAVIHGDLNESNLFLTDTNDSKLIDWSFSRVGHPFFILGHSLFSTYDRQHRMFNERARLREAYLEPWRAYSSAERLLDGLHAARRLIPIEAAQCLAGYIRGLEKEEPGNVRYIPRLLRRALSEFGLTRLS